MKPNIFIGSSTENREIAEALIVNFDKHANCTFWPFSFPLSSNIIDSLLNNFASQDFGIFIFSADDIATIRKRQYNVTRDNIVFEAGLFMGMHGKDRCFIITANDMGNSHIPSDLNGLVVGYYDGVRAKTSPIQTLVAVSTLIRNAIHDSTWSKLILEFSIKTDFTSSPNYPFKLKFTLSNRQYYPVAVDTMMFHPKHLIRFSRDFNRFYGSVYKARFTTHHNPNEIHNDECIIEAKGQVTGWIPLVIPVDTAEIEKALTDKTGGSVKFRCSWFTKEKVIVNNYEYQF